MKMLSQSLKVKWEHQMDSIPEHHWEIGEGLQKQVE